MVDINVVMQEVNQTEGLSFQAIEAEGPYVAMYSGEYHRYGTLKLGFKASFPYTLPSFFISPVPAMRLHIDNEGKICLTDESSLLLNVSKPAQLIIECLRLVDRVFNLSFNDPQYQAELKKEFLSYWGVQGHRISIWSIFPVADCQLIQEIPLFRTEKSYILAPSLSDANCFLCDYCGLPSIDASKRTSQYAWVIRLKDGAPILSPFKKYNWSDIIRYIKNNTDKETRNIFWELTSKSVTKTIVQLIFVVPASSRAEGDIVFGVFVGINNAHKLPIKASRSQNVQQVNVIRFDYDYLLTSRLSNN